MIPLCASFWPALWGWVLVISIGGYALLVVVVTIGGLGDIRAMFRALGDPERDDESRG